MHVLDGAGTVVAQDDRLDVPAWDWQPGDSFVQLHRCTLRADLLPGRYAVALGIAVFDGETRLPVLAGGEPLDERLFLAPVEVWAP
jgi:hypothetical protein